MKYLFGFVLLLIVAAGGLMGSVVVLRWTDNMTETVKVVPGERVFTMPAGTLPRMGGELTPPREEREAAAKRPNPVKATAQSAARGKALFAIYCAPCHGPGGKGDGLVAPKFIPPPDLTNVSLQKQRTDGYLQHVIGTGGAVMPAYGEALSPEERWDLVNYVRTLAQK
ncbi:MAG: cytochrome c [Candidatus Rokubacteria bacterium]|nr:cytochrome c [Candidatus Rokubacteria bacterium]